MKTENETNRLQMALAQKTMETTFLVCENAKLTVNSFARITELQNELKNSEEEKANITDQMAKKVQDQEEQISSLRNDKELLLEDQAKARARLVELVNDLDRTSSELRDYEMDNCTLSYANEQTKAEILTLKQNISQREARIVMLESESSQLLASNEELQRVIKLQEDQDFYASSPELSYLEPEPEPLNQPGDAEPTEFFSFAKCVGPPFATLLTSGVKWAEGNNSPWETVKSRAWIHICTPTRSVNDPGHIIGAVEYAYSLNSKVAKRWFPTQFSCGFLVDMYAWQHFMGASILYDKQDYIKVDPKIRNIVNMKFEKNAGLRQTCEETLRRYINSGRRKMHQGKAKITLNLVDLASIGHVY